MGGPAIKNAGPSHTRNTTAGDVFNQSPYAYTQEQKREEEGTAGRVSLSILILGLLCNRYCEYDGAHAALMLGKGATARRKSENRPTGVVRPA